VNCDKLPRILPEFKPQWSARKGAEELYDAFKMIGVTLEEFEGPKYQRIAHIRKLLNDRHLDEVLRWKAGWPSPPVSGNAQSMPSLDGI
jgi:hypothetical protein